MTWWFYKQRTVTILFILDIDLVRSDQFCNQDSRKQGTSIYLSSQFWSFVEPNVFPMVIFHMIIVHLVLGHNI